MRGRLKHSLKERCPECRSTLQLRAISVAGMEKGVEITISEEIVICPNCEYERSAEKANGKKRRILAV